jgi:hypothetical protein
MPKSEVTIVRARRDGKPRSKVVTMSPDGYQSYSYVTRNQCIYLAQQLLETAEFLKGK